MASKFSPQTQVRFFLKKNQLESQGYIQAEGKESEKCGGSLRSPVEGERRN
jgi:hypothetical protein